MTIIVEDVAWHHFKQITKICVFTTSLQIKGAILLMAEILHHLGCMKPYK